MTREKLEKGRHIKGEILDIQEELKQLVYKKNRQYQIKTSNRAAVKENTELDAAISRHIAVLEKKELQLQNLQLEIEEFLASISDSYIRRIVRLWCIHCLTWNQIAHKLGGTEDSVRKTYTRFFAKL